MSYELPGFDNLCAEDIVVLPIAELVIYVAEVGTPKRVVTEGFWGLFCTHQQRCIPQIRAWYIPRERSTELQRCLQHRFRGV